MRVWQTLLLPPTSPWTNSLETPCRDQSTWRDPLPAPSPSVKLWNESDSLRSLVEVPDRSLGRCQQAPGELAACGCNGKIFPIFLQIWNFITYYPDLQTIQLIRSSPSLHTHTHTHTASPSPLFHTWILSHGICDPLANWMK